MSSLFHGACDCCVFIITFHIGSLLPPNWPRRTTGWPPGLRWRHRRKSHGTKCIQEAEKALDKAILWKLIPAAICRASWLGFCRSLFARRSLHTHAVFTSNMPGLVMSGAANRWARNGKVSLLSLGPLCRQGKMAIANVPHRVVVVTAELWSKPETCRSYLHYLLLYRRLQ